MEQVTARRKLLYPEPSFGCDQRQYRLQSREWETGTRQLPDSSLGQPEDDCFCRFSFFCDLPTGGICRFSGQSIFAMLLTVISCEQAGDSWLLNCPSNCLPFILGDSGYEVWIGNSRTADYSSGHVTLQRADEVLASNLDLPTH